MGRRRGCATNRDTAYRRDTRTPPWRRSSRRSPFGARSAPATIRRAPLSPLAASRPGSRTGFPIPPSSRQGPRSVEYATARISAAISPDHIDLGVVGDRLQRDMRHALVDEALADIVVGRCFLGWRAADLAFLALPLGTVGEQVIGVARAHDPRPCQRQCHTRGVNRNPAPSPLFGDICRRTGAAGRVEHEVAGIGGHQDAALNYLAGCLNYISFFVGEVTGSCVCP